MPSASYKDPSTLPIGNKASTTSPRLLILSPYGSPCSTSWNLIWGSLLNFPYKTGPSSFTIAWPPALIAPPEGLILSPTDRSTSPHPDIDFLCLLNPVHKISHKTIDVPQGPLIRFPSILHILPCPLYPNPH